MSYLFRHSQEDQNPKSPNQGSYSLVHSEMGVHKVRPVAILLRGSFISVLESLLDSLLSISVQAADAVRVIPH